MARLFNGWREEQILRRTKIDHDAICAYCGKPIGKGSLADTRDRQRYFCDEFCEKQDRQKRNGRPEPTQANLR